MLRELADVKEELRLVGAEGIKGRMFVESGGGFCSHCTGGDAAGCMREEGSFSFNCFL